MRILMISYYFAPQNLIGAVRPTKLAKYLARMGHEVTVICGAGRDGQLDPTLQRDLGELTDVHTLEEWNPLRAWKKRKGAAPSSAGKTAAEPVREKGLAFRLVDGAYIALRWLADRSFARLGCRELRRLSGTYDVVFSTYAPFSVHEIACRAKRMGLARRWIADFRDEVGMPFAFQEGRKRRYLRMLRREADVLCAVSDGFLDMMGFSETGRVLSNGFDREDIARVEAMACENRLRVVYCGQLCDSRRELGRRDITPMFRALAALVREGALAREELCLVYAGREGALFAQYAASCGLEDCVEDHGPVSREASIALQKGADILLMASHHTAAQRGILTGKLFEYMMMDKPIVCCMAGDLPGSGVRAVLEQTGMGFCCEAANAQTDEARLLAYVRGLVAAYHAKEPLLREKRDDAVEAYAYPRLAERLSGWMCEKGEEMA